MTPPMREIVTLLVPTGQKDDYGRPVTKPITTKARVEKSSHVVVGTNGQQIQTRLTVDLPPDIQVNYQTSLEYKDQFGEIIKGQVLNINEARNLPGNVVHFRTVMI